ncbi:MAG: DUF1223 domain-containing protein [Acidobacteriota bacterium]
MARVTVGRLVPVMAGVGFPGLAVMLGLSVARGQGAASQPDHGLSLDDDRSAPVGPAIVVAELFTSEGCSSCPPADEVLSRLAVEPLIPGVQVLALGEHVDYWDRLGWKDPFSSPIFTGRQSQYHTQVFRRSSVYTPQLVVDGQFEGIGSDLAAVKRAIVRAAHAPKATVAVSWTALDADLGKATVQIDVPSEVILRERADVMVAVTQNRLTTDVRRGENRGRQLTHSAVVHSLTPLGTLGSTARTFSTPMVVPVAPEWRRSDIRIVAFLQEREGRRIVGAGSTRIDGPGGSGE